MTRLGDSFILESNGRYLGTFIASHLSFVENIHYVYLFKKNTDNAEIWVLFVKRFVLSKHTLEMFYSKLMESILSFVMTI